MERLDIYDYRGVSTGRTIDRSQEDTLSDGEYFLIVHVCLLIQQRRKPGDPLDGCWDLTVAGHVHSGESSQAAAMREVREEIGFPVDLTGQAPLMRLRFHHGFDDIYVVIADVPLSSLHQQDAEVRAARYAACDEVLHMIHRQQFLPYMDSFIEALYDMRCSNGFIRSDAPSDLQ